MNFEIELKSEQAQKDTDELLSYLKEERIKDFQVEKKISVPKTGDMGADTFAIISAVMGAPIVSVIVKEVFEIVKSYLKSNRKSVVNFKFGDKNVELEYNNIDSSVTLDKLLELFKEQGETKSKITEIEK